MVNSNYKQNRVSVIIPTYNYGHFITDCMQSALNQNYSDIEIIVVDDGSTDDTKRIVKPYADRIKYIYQDNSGLSSARNTGLNYSSGEYLLFLDSDDMLHPDSIKHRINFLNANPDKKIAVCRNKLFKDLYNTGVPKTYSSWYLHRKSLNIHLFYRNIAPPHAFMLHRDVINDVGYFDPDLKACEDYDYWMRAIFMGYVPYYCDKGVVYYRQHNSSMSSNRVNQYYHDGLMVLRLRDLINKTDYPNNINSSEANLAFTCGYLKSLYTLDIIKKDIKSDTGKNESLDLLINSLVQITDNVFDNLSNSIKRCGNSESFITSLYLMKLSNFVYFHKKVHTYNSEQISSNYLKIKEAIPAPGGKNFLSTFFDYEISFREKLFLTYEYIKKYYVGRKLINLYCGDKGITDNYFPVHYN